MNKKETLIVNLIGGPCSGKSTVAAELFARLKKMGIKCELVPEYIKEEIYDEHNLVINDQIYLFSHELHQLLNKINKVDVIIHDGSLLLNINYDKEDNKIFHELIITEYNKFNNLDFFLCRNNIKFEKYGRIHDENESKIIDEKIKNLYHKYNLNFIELDSKDSVDKIIKYIFDKLNEKV